MRTRFASKPRITGRLAPAAKLVVATLGLGLFLPPFGLGFFIACALGRTTVERAARSYVPYLVSLLLGLLIVAFVPWLTLVLPRLLNL